MNANVYKIQLVKEKEVEFDAISSASDVVKILQSVGLDMATEEYFYTLCMNAKGDVIGVHEVSHGDLTMCPVHPREIFKRAVANNAASIVIAHNHPSGHIDPSREDDVLTERICRAGKMMGIKVLDHIIVTEKNYYSYVAENDSFSEWG